jgi:(1->4)-alpha-D-glucan 1-alpha-D-glucosylmutase
MGKQAENVCAFARRIGNTRILIAVPRFFTKLIPQQTALPFGEKVWGDSFVVVPIADPGARYRNIFSGEFLTAHNYKDATALRLSEVFSNFPVAMLERLN